MCSYKQTHLYTQKNSMRLPLALKNVFSRQMHVQRATSKTWSRTLDPDPEKHGINIVLKNMSDFRELCFIKTIRNVIYCLKVRVLTDI